MRVLILAAARADIVVRYREIAEADVEPAERWLDALEAATERLRLPDGARAGWPFEARRAALRGRGLRIVMVGGDGADSALLFRPVRNDLAIVRVLDVKRPSPEMTPAKANVAR